ncbi:MAG: bifunctional 3-demethylubiquinol 3-O-methyltransferase/2-polyprenyl-6-hydroxyphenol methylase [Gammaproteobacteria bacterium RIFCSPHIGHO2_12_FULL_42_13]|nr:MAG: bifunctional 3-demethylubiquinol 3-O-methyltransferase/2-polyprenyl-6-hydroxyphenol methylase [Gammaproteobacteria bacterium RIFCSPHIGHO2_12_FULL_42_13]
MADNVNPEEIHKFSAIADQWWDPEGPMKPLHQLNPLRFSYVQQHAELEKKSILDIGCGGGILTESLTKAGGIVTGIDLSDEAIQIAKKHALGASLSTQYHTIHTEDFAKQHPVSFDVITCMEMLEHVPDPQEIVNATAQLIKPGGKIFFSTLNRTVKSFFQAIVGAEYILQLLPRGTHHYSAFIRPSELNHWASQAGLTLQDIQGIQYHPLKKTFSLTQDVSVNYVIFFTGSRGQSRGTT